MNRVLTTIPLSFYQRDTISVAKDILGKVMRVKNRNIWRSGIIVEDEAYLRNDPASHSFKGLNKRNQSMFNDPGTVYVFKIHRVHCVNVVTHEGEAVLIRALEPLENISMPTNGPGKLCNALNITKDEHDGQSITGNKIQIIDNVYPDLSIQISGRVGISKSKEWPLRFYVKENPFVSR